MSPRHPKTNKEDVLLKIVELYVEQGRAVSSHMVSSAGMDCSSATIRNIMVELMDEGYLQKTHNMSARVPTYKALRYYIDYALERGVDNNDFEIDIDNAVVVNDMPHSRKIDHIVKKTVDLVSEALKNLGIGIFWGDDLIYTHGLRYLLQSPEFSSIEKARSIARIIDEEDTLKDIMKVDIPDRVVVYFGEELGIEEFSGCALFICSCGNYMDKEIRLGVIGPTRVNYPQNIALLEKVSSRVEELL